jgi:calnexin
MRFSLCSSLLLLIVALSVSLAEEDGEVIDETIQNEPEAPTVPREKINFTPPEIPASAFYALYFSSPSDLTTKLIKSLAKKEGVDEVLAKYDGIWTVEVPTSSAILNDYALIVKSKARHHAISASFEKPIDFTSHDQIVIQYEVKFQTPMECGGAYVKLLTQQSNLNLKEFNDKTPYTIMFGPDKCGLDHKLHFIFRHKNPITGEFEEKHAKKPSSDINKFFSDQKTHLYTLVLSSDNTFTIYVDQSVVNYGSLLNDFEPSVNPPKEIDDPSDKKTDDWDEREKIADPNSQKPDDWDESQPEYIEDKDAVKPDGWLDEEEKLIPDTTSEKPSDWDADMDGEWEAPKVDNPKCKDAPGCGPWTRPQIKNPLYKGKWSPPMIDNPAYKGIWKPRRIENPNYFEDAEPFRRMTPIGALGLELWSMTDEIAFDNFFLGYSKADADKFAQDTWVIKSDEERKSDPKAQSVVDAIQEATRERPWIWGIVVLVIGLPIVLIIAYCCLRGTPNQRIVDESGRRKKTDEPQPDDVNNPATGDNVEGTGEDEEEEEEGEEEEVGDEEQNDQGLNSATTAAASSAPAPVGKASLETDSEEEKSVDKASSAAGVNGRVSGGSEKSASSEEDHEEKPAPPTTRRRMRKD